MAAASAQGHGGHTPNVEKAANIVNAAHNDMPEYRIGAVTKELDLGQYTLKHYERQGLIEPATSEAGFRFYTRSDFGKIITIRSLRRLGFSVEEIGELLAADDGHVLDAMDAKMLENERAIAELQEANRLLHRHVSSLRNNLERPRGGVFEPEAAGLVFVPHFRGDELAGGKTLVDGAAWRDLYEWSLLGMRIEQASVGGRGLAGCWWGLVPLGDRRDVERSAATSEQPVDVGAICEVTPGPAVLASLCAVESSHPFDLIRTATVEALASTGRTLAGDVYAIADAVHLQQGEGLMTLTLRIPVER